LIVEKMKVLKIGRAQDNDYVVDNDPTVDLYHCEIIMDDSGIRLRDLNSTNGTFVNLKTVGYFDVLNTKAIVNAFENEVQVNGEIYLSREDQFWGIRVGEKKRIAGKFFIVLLVRKFLPPQEQDLYVGMCQGDVSPLPDSYFSN